jgi:hypothetical protein
VQFVSFILLCGFIHLTGARGLFLSLLDQIVLMAFLYKAGTALVSCMTAFSLLREIPRFLRTQEREHRVTTKTEELDKEVGLLLSVTIVLG